MRFTKQTFVTSFALFSLFFGAGNLILPPFLGFGAGDSWFVVLIGFVLSAVVIPILAIFGHARLQGTVMDFAKKVSPQFAVVYCFIIYGVAASLPGPRTASVTYEMAIQPHVELSSLELSTIYFSLVFLIAINRSKVMDVVGKFLTPGILILLALVVVIGLFGDYKPANISSLASPFTEGFLEGYQTFDAIGGVVVGAVVVISLGIKGGTFEEKKRVLRDGGILAGTGLLLIYGGMLYLGSLHSGMLETTDRTALLKIISTENLGAIGANLLAVLVSLACFTTAVGIVTGTSDFIKGICRNSKKAYMVSAFFTSVLGVLMGQMDVQGIIDIAFPALMLVYPITIVLIFLNALPEKYASHFIFRVVVITTIIFSLPDFLNSIGHEGLVLAFTDYVPLTKQRLAWVLPSFLAFIALHVFDRVKR